MIKNINFGKRVLSKYNEFHVNPEISLSEQLLQLDEDLIQICYDEQYILDVGWYPAFNIEGNFRVVIIKDCDWEKPVLTREYRDIKILKEHIEECVRIIQNEFL